MAPKVPFINKKIGGSKLKKDKTSSAHDVEHQQESFDHDDDAAATRRSQDENVASESTPFLWRPSIGAPFGAIRKLGKPLGALTSPLTTAAASGVTGRDDGNGSGNGNNSHFGARTYAVPRRPRRWYKDADEPWYHLKWWSPAILVFLVFFAIAVYIWMILPHGSKHDQTVNDAAWRMYLQDNVSNAALYGNLTHQHKQQRHKVMTQQNHTSFHAGGAQALHDKKTSTTLEEDSSDRTFDYIIVGAGPAGVLLAVRLARAMADVSVLLLESGTDAQSAVLRNLQRQATQRHYKQSMRARMRHQSHDSNDHANAPTAEAAVCASDPSFFTQPSEMYFDDAMKTIPLNVFDVPLLWSGLASAQERRKAMGMEIDSPHHWPIDKTLLGRGIGGCGLHNAMVYVRSLRSDWDDGWSNVSERWSWRDVKDYYAELENYVVPLLDDVGRQFWSQTKRRSTDRNGGIVTEPASVGLDAIAPLFVRSALHTGWPLAVRGFNTAVHDHDSSDVDDDVRNFNATSTDSQQRLGAGYYDFNIRHGVRDSVAHALMGVQPPPPNLHVWAAHTVTQVLFQNSIAVETDSEGERHGRQPMPEATGVQFVNTITGQAGIVMLSDHATSEVALATGAILTPQILHNSGIGPGGHVADLLGVGKNLQDHPVVALSMEIDANMTQQGVSSMYTLGDEMEDYKIAVEQLQRHAAGQVNLTKELHREVVSKIGTLGTPGFGAGAFLASPWASQSGVPDIQLTVFPRQMEPHVTRQPQEQGEAYMRSHAMLITVALLQAEARYQVYPSQSRHPLIRMSPGVVANTSSSEMQALLDLRLPAIELPTNTSQYLTDNDVDRLVWGLQQVRNICATSPLANVTGDEIHPGRQVQRDDDLRRWVRASQTPNAHWVGSTKAGSSQDVMAVVDDRLRVYGTRKLRLVNAGVIPTIPNGNTHSAVTIVAAHAAHLMVQDRQRRRS